MTQLTIRIPIKASESAQKALLKTMESYTESFERICAYGWGLRRVNRVEIHKGVYRNERNLTHLPAQLVCSSISKSTEALKSARAWQKKRDVFNKRAQEKGKRQKPAIKCPQPRGLAPIRCDQRSSTISLSEGYATLASVSGRQRIVFRIPEYYRDKENWKVCSSDLVWRDKLWLHVVVKDPHPRRFEWNGSAVGIDIGLTHPAVTSQNKFLGKKTWREVDDRYFRLNRALQAKGTKSAKRHLKKLSHRRTRFRQNCDHVLSKQIVEACVTGTVIAMEDIKHIRAQVRHRGTRARRRFHGWSFNRLETYVEYKSQLAGCKLEKVDPRNTSRRCSRCGCVNKNNRKSQSNFQCKACGYRLHADLNASRNIELRFLADRGISLARGQFVNLPIVASTESYKPTASAVGS